MKKIYLAIMLFVGLMTFTSCEKEEVNPGITSNSENSIIDDDTLSFLNGNWYFDTIGTNYNLPFGFFEINYVGREGRDSSFYMFEVPTYNYTEQHEIAYSYKSTWFTISFNNVDSEYPNHVVYMEYISHNENTLTCELRSYQKYNDINSVSLYEYTNSYDVQIVKLVRAID